jgi:hypothetical protein
MDVHPQFHVFVRLRLADEPPRPSSCVTLPLQDRAPPDVKFRHK